MLKVDYKKASKFLDGKNPGCAEYQILRFTERINQLSEHLSKNKHDYRADLCLRKLINKKKRMVKYLKLSFSERYDNFIKTLGRK